MGDEASSASYSLIGVGQAIQESVIDPGAGTSFIQACFFIFALAVPLSHLLCLMMLWLIPMSGTAQRRLVVVASPFVAFWFYFASHLIFIDPFKTNKQTNK